MTDRPIGIFDSGIGGLTVVKAIIDLLPNEDIVYFGDTARVPYGPKSAATVTRYATECLSLLLAQKIKLLVIACHTVSTNSLTALEAVCPIPILGVVTPSIQRIIADLAPTNPKLAIIGTRSTINSNTYPNLLHTYLPKESIVSIACPLLVPLIEEGYLDHPMTTLALQEYFSPIVQQSISTVLLGCTHYPLLIPTIINTLGMNLNLIDPGKECARQLHHTLIKQHLLKQSAAPAKHRFIVSDDPVRFKNLGEAFLQQPIPCVELASN